MINELKYIRDKTLEIEESLEKIHNENLKKYKSFITINKNLLNYSVLSASEISLYDTFLTKNTSIYFSLNINFYLPSSQNIEFMLLVNNICLSKSTQYFNNGKNEITLNRDFNAITNTNYNIKAIVKSINGKQIEINNIKLLIYGIEKETDNVKHQTLTINNNKLLVAYLSNNELFYLITNKDKNYYNNVDFKLLSNAIDFCFIADKTNNNIMLAKIDNNYILTLSNIDMHNLIFIDDKTTAISAVWGNNQILVCYIKNNICHYFIIENNSKGEVYKLENFINITKVKACYNFNNNKFYIVLTDINYQNYLIESLNTASSSCENIKVDFSYTIATYGVKDEI